MSVPDNFVAPNLPLTTGEYEQVSQEQFRNVLRLYFKRVDEYHRITSEQVASSQTLIWLDM